MRHLIRFPVWLLLLLIGWLSVVVWFICGVALIGWRCYSHSPDLSGIPEPTAPVDAVLSWFEKAWPYHKGTP